jgi:hypothetical protein
LLENKIKAFLSLGGPLLLFNSKGDTLIISQMSQFMVTSMENEEKAGGSIGYGIMGGIDQIDSNFSVDFLLYYSDKGINKVKAKN